MDFALYVNRVDTMYITLLESGGQDAIALKHGIDAARKALKLLTDPATESKLNSAQQRHRDSLLLIGEHVGDDQTDWAARREWLEEARKFLLRLPQ